MLYCEECREGSEWPISIRGEYGKCYICGNITFCNSEDVKIQKFEDLFLERHKAFFW